MNLCKIIAHATPFQFRTFAMTKSYLWPLTACLLLACQPGGVDETPVQTDVDAAVDTVDAPQIELSLIHI